MSRSKSTCFERSAALVSLAASAAGLAGCSGNPCEPVAYYADSGALAPLSSDPYVYPSAESGYVRTADLDLSFVPVDSLRRRSYSSYETARSRLAEGYLPWAYGIRTPDFVSRFDYGYPPPQGDALIHGGTLLTEAPWNAEHLLARIHLKARPDHVLFEGARDPVSGAAAFPLVTGARMRVSFDPRKVRAFRMIGVQADHAGNAYIDGTGSELVPGEEVTVLYELVPETEAGHSTIQAPFYSVEVTYADAITGVPGSLSFATSDSSYVSWTASPEDLKFAAAAAAFGMLLSESPYSGGASFDAVIAWATQGLGDDPESERRELIEMAKAALSARPSYEYPYDYGYDGLDFSSTCGVW